MADSPEKKPRKIIILDDDHYPEGRITQKLLPVFEDHNLRDLVIHFDTFSEYKKYLDDPQNIKEVGIIVMDCSLVNENKMYTFQETLPFTISVATTYRLDLLKCIMPASGNMAEGIKNNRYAEELFDRRGYIMDWEQTALSNGGLAYQNTESIFQNIAALYEKRYPGVLSKEGVRKSVEQNTQKPEGNVVAPLEGESEFWKQTLTAHEGQCNGVTSPKEDNLHSDITEMIFKRALTEEPPLDTH